MKTFFKKLSYQDHAALSAAVAAMAERTTWGHERRQGTTVTHPAWPVFQRVFFRVCDVVAETDDPAEHRAVADRRIVELMEELAAPVADG